MMEILEMLELAAQAVGVFSVVASITPTPKDDGIALKLSKVLNLGAFNVFKAKNAE